MSKWLLCRWCGATFRDPEEHREHETIHRDLDVLNGRSYDDDDGPSPAKRSKGASNNYFSDDFLDELMGDSQQTGRGPDDSANAGRRPAVAASSSRPPPDAAAAAPDSPVPDHAPDTPVPGPSDDEDRELDYDFRQVGQRTFKNSVVDRHFKVTIRPDDASQGKKLSDLHDRLEDMFDEVIDAAREGLEGSDLGRVIVHHDALANPIFVPLRQLDRLSGREVMDRVEAVLNSHEDLPMNESFRVDVGTMELPKGGGSGDSLPLNVLWGPDNSLQRKKSIVEIVNDDQTCMARAVVMAYLAANVVNTSEWRAHGTDPDRPMERRVLDVGKCPEWYFKDLKKEKKRYRQTALTVELCRRAGVPTNRRLTLVDAEAFEQVLDVDVLVVGSRVGNKFIRVPERCQAEEETRRRQRLYLYLVERNDESHFHAIVNICGFFAKGNFCSHCLKPYKDLHQCLSACFACKRKEGCPTGDDRMSCRTCHVTCRSWDCFQAHREVKRGKETPCQRWWKCCTCKKVIDRRKRDPERHVCGEWHCRCCHRYVDRDHLCYIRVTESNDSKPRFVFFDFECTQDDHVVQCQEGYRPPRNVDCTDCKDKDMPCSTCGLCVHCQRSWCGKSRHVPNLVVAHKVCEECVDREFPDKCSACGTRCSKCDKYDKKEKCYEREPCQDTCGFRETVFEGDDTGRKFGRWLFSEKNKGFTAVAHNLKGYDGYFLLEYLIDNSMKPEKIVYAGSKVMYFHVANGLDIRVADSLNFLPMKLASLPNAFDLKENKKGYFPHFFNRKENRHYVGPYPSPESYGCDGMKAKDRAEFLRWYELKKGEVFDFDREILEYCRSDVDILRRACLKFRHILMSITGEEEIVLDEESGTLDTALRGGIDPFDSITIAAVCMRVFKQKFLTERWRAKLRRCDDVSDWLPAARVDGKLKVCVDDEWLEGSALQRKDYLVEEAEFVDSPIAQVPSQGYASRDNYSQVSIQWLEWCMEQSRRSGNPIRIRHALNDGEYALPGTRYRLDGYCAETNTAYEFQGCFWHGCPVCYPTQRQRLKTPRTDQSMEELYTLTIKKREYVKSLKMNYVEMWEHDFYDVLRNDEEAKTYVDSLHLQERLNPRESFFGGRTNATTLYRKVNEGEKIHYLDFCSLYPSVNKYGRYPVGHPRIVTGEFEDIGRYFGIAKIKILPPTGLYHPVLPAKVNGKLTFTLCRSCAERQNQETCVCSDEDRCLTGTWCTPEIEKALDRGYILKEIYEVYHFEKTEQYDRLDKTGGLFGSYVNMFLKIKQESSGWPDWVRTEDDKMEYLKQYEEKEGIRLDPEKVRKNLALRSIAKLLLNSFWGKFGQRLNLPQTTYFHDSEADEFFRCISDPSKVIKDFCIVSHDTLQLSWENKSVSVMEDFQTNVFIATFTTCWARLKLYEILEMLQKRVLYFDTDSVVFVSRPGDSNPEVGSFLGQLTDELKPDDGHIVEFVSGGPKNYAYRTASGREVCKVRGFSLNYENSRVINFKSMLDLIVPPEESTGDKPDEITVYNPKKIARLKWQRKVYNRQEEKRYKMVYNKRVMQKQTHDTLPYGY